MQFLMELWGKFARLQQIRKRQISWVLPDASGIVGGAPTESSLNELTPVLPVGVEANNVPSLATAAIELRADLTCP